MNGAEVGGWGLEVGLGETVEASDRAPQGSGARFARAAASRADINHLRRLIAFPAQIDVGFARRKYTTMGTIRSHRDLEAWQVAMELVDQVYRLTEGFPAKEMYGLQGQLRRAAVSVPSNVAEGQARPIRAALNQLSIAVGSLAEIDTQMEIAKRRKYIDESSLEQFSPLLESTFRLVRGLGRAKKRLLVKTVAQTSGVLLVTFYMLSGLFS